MVAMSRPSIAVYGASEGGVQSFVRTLLQLPDSAAVQSVYAWGFDNKYYQADVQVTAAAFGEAAEALRLPANCEAVVLVVDLTSPASWESASRWASQQRDLLEGLEIKLCVGALAHASSAPPPEATEISDAMQIWCEQCNFEFVMVGQTPSTCAANEVDSLEEPAGYARVTAALEAHMWPGLRLKTRATNTTATAGSAARAQQEQPQTSSGSTTPLTDSDSLRAGAAAAALHDSSSHAKVAIAGEQPLLPKHQRPDDEFDALFEQLQGARDRQQRLPDDQRREAAAEMALKLLHMLELGSDEEDMSESDDEGDATAQQGQAA